MRYPVSALIMCIVPFACFGDTNSLKPSGYKEEITIDLPKEADLNNFAKSLAAEYNEKFEIHRLVSIYEKINSFLNAHFSLSASQKQAFSNRILDAFIDYTDTPYLPDLFFDPLFKMTLPYITSVVFMEPPCEITRGLFTSNTQEKHISELANDIISQISGKINLKDLPHLFSMSIQLAFSFEALSKEEKIDCAKQVLCQVLDQTDTPFLPDFIFDEVFKRLGCDLIDYLATSGFIA